MTQRQLFAPEPKQPSALPRQQRVEFTQPPVRPNPERGLIWLSDCGHYAVILGDRLFGTPMVELGLVPLYRGVFISPDGQRLIRRKNGRAGRRSFEQACADCRRHERQTRLAAPKHRRRHKVSRGVVFKPEVLR